MIPFVVFSMRRAWQGFWRNALMSMAATLTMVLMLSLLAGFFILQNVLLASLSFVEDKVEVVAYVENTATQLDGREATPRATAVSAVRSPATCSTALAIRPGFSSALTDL